MKLTFLYITAPDLAAAVAFYRDALGLDESWREGDDTVAFKLPGTDIELMIDRVTDGVPANSAGGFFMVDSVDQFRADRPALAWVGDTIDIPGGRAATFTDPGGNSVRVFDQTTAEPPENA